MDNEEFLTVKEAMAATGLARATIFKLLKEHNLTRYQVAGSREIYIKRADLEELRRPVPRDRPPRQIPVESQAKKLAA